jgi:hypothetical protein
MTSNTYIPTIFLGASCFLGSAVYDFDNSTPINNLSSIQNYYSMINNEVVLQSSSETEPIIQLKTTQKIRVRIKKSSPLEYIQVEDEKGFL